MDRDESVRRLVGHALNDHYLDDFERNESIGNHILANLKEAGFLADEATPNGTTLYSVIADIREKSGVGSKPMLSELADAIAARIKPTPSPDVAGVVDADLIERVSGRLKQRAHNREQLEGIKASHAIEHVAATLLESLSAEKGRLVGLVKDLDDALCAAQEKLQGNPLVLKWVIEIIGDARARARTALTPKEKA